MEHASPTVEEREEFLGRLLALWCCHPQLRLGQLISNCFRDEALYHVPDHRFLDELEAFYAKIVVHHDLP